MNEDLDLVAPAGDWDALRAAACNGADAVYFGLTDFNARLRAANFTPESLPDVLRYLHNRGVRGHLALNILVYPDELPRVAERLSAAARAGVDAVIVQDLGVARLARRLAPSLPVHASTQMTLASGPAIAFARGLGLARVILPRELPLDAIRRLAAGSPMRLEVFVHGALCIAVGGQCFASLALGGRSANRGLCAQPCRLPYRLAIDGAERDPGGRLYLLSPRDLAAHDRIAALVAAGARAFKIEGRQKDAAYVAAAVRAYRAALDAARAGRPFRISGEAAAALDQSFSRGFSAGFLDGPDARALVDGRSTKPRGTRVGTVAGAARGALWVDLDPSATLSPGDGIVVASASGPAELGGRVFAVGPAAPPGGRRPGASRPAGVRRVAVSFGRGRLRLDAAAPGAAVWKTDDPALRRRLDATFARDAAPGRVPVTWRVRARVGEPLRATLRDDRGLEVDVAGDRPLERAEKHPLTLDALRDQLGRLGGTPFALAGVEAPGLEPVMASRGALNAVRRDAVARLEAARRAARARPVAAPDALESLRAEIRARRPPGRPAGPASLGVLARTPEQLDALLAPRGRRPEFVIADLPEGRREAVARCRAAAMPVGLAAPRVVLPGEEDRVRALADLAPDVVLVRDLAALAVLREYAPAIPCAGDFSLNAVNELSADGLADAGLARLAPGLDLSWPRLRLLLDRIDPGLFEIVVHQHVPLFHTAHCLYAAALSEGSTCRDCGRPCDRHRAALRDRTGAVHPVFADAAGRNTVFHAAAQSAVEWLPAMRRAGLRHFRIDLLGEDGGAARDVVETYRLALDGRLDGRAAWRRLRAREPGGLTRGTWAGIRPGGEAARAD